MKNIRTICFRGITLLIGFGIASLCLIAGFLYGYAQFALPDVSVLSDYPLQQPLRIYTEEGLLMAQYGEKRREPIALEAVPTALVQAIVATEDARFYRHAGVDPIGLLRAAIDVIVSGEKTQGGSTITMQVARNYFLSRHKTYTRKLNEVLLALKIDAEWSKEKILELYLNKIYFGQRAYGIKAAAKTYYGVVPADLTLPQMAMLAGLPKAPSTLNPLTNPERARGRRNYVLQRMRELKFIDADTYQTAVTTPLTATYHTEKIQVTAPYVAESIRQTMLDHNGEKIYTAGWRVMTTINAQQQQAAQQALEKGLFAYDQRHGYRGPSAHIDLATTDAAAQHAAITALPQLKQAEAALVTAVTPEAAELRFSDDRDGILPRAELLWARSIKPQGQLGPDIESVTDVLQAGDIIYVQAHGDNWHLSQPPDVEGAIVATDPDTGGIRAMVGGFDFERSHFNRANQSERQLGSCIKPFIYTAALEEGYTLASIINDSPVVLQNNDEEEAWRPQNHNGEFSGPTRLRIGLIKSHNLVSIRLLKSLKMPHMLDTLQRFGFDITTLPKTLSLALGSNTISPLDVNRAYATFVNGGYHVDTHLISRIENSKGDKLWVHEPVTAYRDCEKPAPTIISPQIAFLMRQALQDVIQHGTGRRARRLGRQDIGGKTGSTNDLHDAWFAGFGPHLVATVWVGFDQPRSLYEYGSKAALPIWIDFMHTALKQEPPLDLEPPKGIVTVRIDPKTGLLAAPGQADGFFEFFREEYTPKKSAPAISEQGAADDRESLF